MIIPNDRYAMHETESSMYAVQMVLSIKNLHKHDFGGYKCISKNSIGGIEATIRLYGKSFFKYNTNSQFSNRYCIDSIYNLEINDIHLPQKTNLFQLFRLFSITL